MSVQPAELAADCPVGKLHETRWRIATALAERGGEVKDKRGGSSGVLAEAAGLTITATGLANLLRRMEQDREVEREVRGKRTFSIRLTARGRARWLPPGAPVPDAPEPAPIGRRDGIHLVSPLPAPPDAGRSILDEDPLVPLKVVDYGKLAGELDHRLLVKALLAELGAGPRTNGNGHHHEHEARIAKLERDLEEARTKHGAMTEEAQRLRGKVGALERQVEELTAKNSDLNKRLRKKEDRAKIVELDAMVRVARRTPGWVVKQTGGNHLQFVSPRGQAIIAPSTPSDYRSMLNTRAELRRAGLEV